MTKPENAKPVRGIDWRGIFERRPDLKPPGYEETLRQVQEKPVDKTN